MGVTAVGRGVTGVGVVMTGGRDGWGCDFCMLLISVFCSVMQVMHEQEGSSILKRK